jgi:beta-lactam-binding protein with PASTA domain
VSKAEYGTLPNLVGSSLEDVTLEAGRLKIRLDAKSAPGRAGTVLRQVPKPGVAVAPGLRVRLVVGDGSRT